MFYGNKKKNSDFEFNFQKENPFGMFYFYFTFFFFLLKKKNNIIIIEKTIL